MGSNPIPGAPLMISNMPSYCSECGSKLTERNVQGRERMFCGECEEVAWVQPKVSAAVIVKKGENILLVKRGVEPRKDTWSLPAGYLDRGEMAVEAAVRELEEETGLVAKESDLSLEVNADVVHPSGRHNLLAVYLVDYSELEGEVESGSDAEKVAFRDPESVDEEGMALEAARRNELV